MLVELAVADAYGCCFEGLDKELIEKHNELKYLTLRDLPSLVPAGCYTDDTQMTIAIAEEMLGSEWTTQGLADRFVSCFQRDKRRGYTTAFLLILMNSQSGAELISKIHGNSKKSGAAMRSSVLGLIKDFNELERKCLIQSQITHNSPEGKNSALAAAMMVHYFYYNLGPKIELSAWLNDQVFGDFWHHPDHWSPSDGKHVRCHGIDVVEAALHAIENNEKLSNVLLDVVGYGGDTDTSATIAIAAACWSDEIKREKKEDIVDGIEEPPIEDPMDAFEELVEEYPALFEQNEETDDERNDN
jgi:ADP-ribosylglycohydrolase